MPQAIVETSLAVNGMPNNAYHAHAQTRYKYSPKRPPGVSLRRVTRHRTEARGNSVLELEGRPQPPKHQNSISRRIALGRRLVAASMDAPTYAGPARNSGHLCAWRRARPVMRDTAARASITSDECFGCLVLRATPAGRSSREHIAYSTSSAPNDTRTHRIKPLKPRPAKYAMFLERIGPADLTTAVAGAA